MATKPTEEQARTAVGLLGSHLSIMLDKHQLPRVVPQLDTLRQYFAPDEPEPPPAPPKKPTDAHPPRTGPSPGKGESAEGSSSSIGGRPSPPAPR